jgi:hypothetical protein
MVQLEYVRKLQVEKDSSLPQREILDPSRSPDCVKTLNHGFSTEEEMRARIMFWMGEERSKLGHQQIVGVADSR